MNSQATHFPKSSTWYYMKLVFVSCIYAIIFVNNAKKKKIWDFILRPYYQKWLNWFVYLIQICRVFFFCNRTICVGDTNNIFHCFSACMQYKTWRVLPDLGVLNANRKWGQGDPTSTGSFQGKPIANGKPRRRWIKVRVGCCGDRVRDGEGQWGLAGGRGTKNIQRPRWRVKLQLQQWPKWNIDMYSTV